MWLADEPIPQNLPGYAALALVCLMGAASIIKALRNGKDKTSGSLDPAEWEQRIDGIFERRLEKRNMELRELFREMQQLDRDECARQVRTAVEEVLKKKGL